MKRNHALVDNYKPNEMLVKYNIMMDRLDVWKENDWDAFCYFNKLSESLMRELKDYFTESVWKTASKHQLMSNDFRREMFVKND